MLRSEKFGSNSAFRELLMEQFLTAERDATKTRSSPSGTQFSVSLFVDLPDDLLLAIFGNWLELGDLSAFDVALCNSATRSKYLSILSTNDLKIRTECLMLVGVNRPPYPNPFRSIGYFVNRNVKVEQLVVENWPFYDIEPPNWRPFMEGVNWITLPVDSLFSGRYPRSLLIPTLKDFSNVKRVHFTEDFADDVATRKVTVREIVRLVSTTWQQVDQLILLSRCVEIQLPTRITRSVKEFAAKLTWLKIREALLSRAHFFRMLVGLSLPNLEELELSTFGISTDDEFLALDSEDWTERNEVEDADHIDEIIYHTTATSRSAPSRQLLNFAEICEVVWKKRKMLHMPKLKSLSGVASVIFPYLLIAPAVETLTITFDINMPQSWEMYTSLYSRINVASIKDLRIDFVSGDLRLSRFLDSMHNLEIFHWRTSQTEVASSDIRDCFINRTKPCVHLSSITIHDSLLHDKRLAELCMVGAEEVEEDEEDHEQNGIDDDIEGDGAENNNINAVAAPQAMNSVETTGSVSASDLFDLHVRKQYEFFSSLVRIAPNLKFLDFSLDRPNYLPILSGSTFNFSSIVGLHHLQELSIEALSLFIQKDDLFELRNLRHFPLLRILSLLTVNRVVNDDILLEILPALVHLEDLRITNDEELTNLNGRDFSYDFYEDNSTDSVLDQSKNCKWDVLRLSFISIKTFQCIAQHNRLLNYLVLPFPCLDVTVSNLVDLACRMPPRVKQWRIWPAMLKRNKDLQDQPHVCLIDSADNLAMSKKLTAALKKKGDLPLTHPVINDD